VISAFGTPTLLHNERWDKISDPELARCLRWHGMSAQRAKRVANSFPVRKVVTAILYIGIVKQ
jgi:predicted metal-dependent hydrolase